MYFTDEKDYIMLMIKEMVRVLFSLMFGKKYVSVELEKENKYEVSGKNLKDFLDMIDSGQINEAENILLDNIDYTNNDDVMAAALFYQYLSEKDSEFLINNNYTKEEVLSGFKQLLVQSEYNNLLYMIKDDE
jgi:polysaccharide pyruvyl transferase WcaK-like protein